MWNVKQRLNAISGTRSVCCNAKWFRSSILLQHINWERSKDCMGEVLFLFLQKSFKTNCTFFSIFYSDFEMYKMYLYMPKFLNVFIIILKWICLKCFTCICQHFQMYLSKLLQKTALFMFPIQIPSLTVSPRAENVAQWTYKYEHYEQTNMNIMNIQIIIRTRRYTLRQIEWYLLCSIALDALIKL